MTRAMPAVATGDDVTGGIREFDLGRLWIRPGIPM
jgi:hypothetical protein